MPGFPAACYGLPCVKHPQQRYAYITLDNLLPASPCGAGPCSGDNCGDCETVQGVYTVESLWPFCELDFINPAGVWQASSLVICDTTSGWMQFKIECNEPSAGQVKGTFTMNLGTGTELIVQKILSPNFCTGPDTCVTPGSFGAMTNIIQTPTDDDDCIWSQISVEVADELPP